MNKVVTCEYKAPCGMLVLGDYNGKLCMCDWVNGSDKEFNDRRIKNALNAEFVEEISPLIERAVLELDEYFNRERKEFDIPLLFVGSDFMKRVWDELLNIPYGTTISYGEQAKRIGNPKAARAVGGANGRNPISIFAPCHRVVGSNGLLTGYGGGIEVKRFLLNLETHPEFDLSNITKLSNILG